MPTLLIFNTELTVLLQTTFVEVGKRDIVDAGNLDMDIFSRNVTFTAFDLTELFYHEGQLYRDIWIKQLSVFD